MKEKQLRNQRGITLIALVVTIIVALILAIIVINFGIGENGIFRQTKTAKNRYINETEKEQVDLEELYSSMMVATSDGSKITISMEDLNTLIDKKVESKIQSMNVEIIPAGTIISYMGNNVPGGYLICNGTEYNIVEYSNLAEQIKTEFGSYNYFGGNGVTTFAVPDLRGEFLRGTGINSHDNQGDGSNVGEHQNGTKHLGLSYNKSSSCIQINLENDLSVSQQSTNYDSMTKRISWIQAYTQKGNGTAQIGPYTSRPTNTSVLYCIKY